MLIPSSGRCIGMGRYREDPLSFEKDAWQFVPVEHGAWCEAKRRYDQLAKALDSVPADHRFGSAFDAICVRLDRLMDDVVETEQMARAAFRAVAA